MLAAERRANASLESRAGLLRAEIAALKAALEDPFGALTESPGGATGRAEGGGGDAADVGDIEPAASPTLSQPLPPAVLPEPRTQPPSPFPALWDLHEAFRPADWSAQGSSERPPRPFLGTPRLVALDKQPPRKRQVWEWVLRRQLPGMIINAGGGESGPPRGATEDLLPYSPGNKST